MKPWRRSRSRTTETIFKSETTDGSGHHQIDRKGRSAWLVDRLRDERPFIFYQSALVLRNLAWSDDARVAQGAVTTARDALAILNASNIGDDNTVNVLTAIASRADAP